MIFFKKLKFSLLLIIALLVIASSLADEYVSFDSYDDLARALGSFDAEQTTQSFSLELKNSYNDTQNFEYLSFPKIGSKMFNLKIKNESLNVFVNQDNSKHSEDNYNYLKIDNSIFEEMNTLDEDSVQVIIKLNLKAVDEKEAMKRADIKSTKTFFDKPLVDENELKKIRFEIAKERVVSVLNRKGETNSIRTINSLATSLNRDELKSISRSEYVDKIYLDYKTKTFLDDSVDIIKANDVWNLTDRNGNFITGKNITVAVLDSGIDYTHMDFGSCTAIGPNCRVIDGYDFINNDYDPMDDEGHGTHVAGIIAANSLAIKGVAPDAKLIAYKTTDENGGGLSSHLLMAIERAIDPNQDGDTSDHYDIITTSTGYDSSSTYDYISTMIDAAVETGVIFIAAAGNDGPGYETISCPACSEKAIAVGASTSLDSVASFSSRGPTNWNTIKPDILAPGVGICSSQWEDVWSSSECLGDGEHTSMSGTSMAAPHIAGAAALLLQAYPERTPDEIKSNLMSTAIQIPNRGVFAQGGGRVDVMKSYNAEVSTDSQSISFGKINPDENILVYNLTIKNLKDIDYNFTISTDKIKDEESKYYDLASVNQNHLFIPAGESRTITLIVDLSESNVDGYLEGHVRIQGENQTQHVPISIIRLFRISVSVQDFEGNALSPELFYIHTDGLRGVERIDQTRFNNTYDFYRRKGTYLVYAIGDRNDLELNYVLMKKIILNGSNVYLNLTLADATPYTVKAESFDGETLRLFGWYKSVVSRTYYPNITVSASSTRDDYGFYGDRIIYISDRPDEKIETDVILKMNGVPDNNDYEIDWSDELTDRDITEYGKFFDNYKTAEEQYFFGFILFNCTNDEDTLYFEEDEVSHYLYHYGMPGGTPESFYNQANMAPAVSINQYASLYTTVVPFSAPLDRHYYFMGTQEGYGYQIDWSFFNFVNINYLSYDPTSPKLTDQQQDFWNAMGQEEQYNSEKGFDAIHAIPGDYKELWFGTAPYNPLRGYIIGYTTPYGDRINVTSTYKFMRGYNYDTYLWKDTEYSVGDEVTGEVYKEISFEKPYYTIYRNGAYMYGTPLVDYYKNWFDYFNFIIYLAADYKVKLEIPTLYELYNKTIDTIEFTFPYLSDVPIIKDINAPPRYEVGVPFTITANITDDTDLKKINFSYWNGFSWIEIPYIVDGDLYSIILNISTLKHLDIIVFAEDEHNQTHQVEIKSVSMKTQPLNFELEYDYEVYKGGDEIYIDGSLLDDDSGAGYLKVDFFVDDLYVDSYPTNDLGNFDFWYDIPLDYANEELKLTMRAGNTGIYDLNEKTIYFDINLEPLHITITNPKNNAVIEDNKVLLTATTNWPATCEYELNYANVWLPMNQTGTTTHSHLIQLDWNNSYVVYLNCSKTDGTFVYEAVRFSTIEEPHYPPILQPISNMTTYENKTITIIASATDANNDDLSFSINDSRFDQNENIFSWTPDFEDAGDYSFRIIVTDNEFNSSQTFRVHVQNTNRKPVINSTPVIDAYVGGKYEYDVDAYDLDGDSLMYGFAITTDMGWLDINSQTGLVEGTPYEEGIFSLLIIVSDEYDEESETYQRFNITVHPGVKISNVSYELTENSAIITWDTNNNSNSIVQYGLDESLSNEINNSNFVRNHEVILSNLEENTDYYFTVLSCDNRSCSVTTESIVYYFKTWLLGDVNYDRELSIEDSAMIVDIILERINPSEYEEYVADMNKDNSVNVLDLVKLLNEIRETKTATKTIKENKVIELDDEYSLDISSSEDFESKWEIIQNTQVAKIFLNENNQLLIIPRKDEYGLLKLKQTVKYQGFVVGEKTLLLNLRIGREVIPIPRPIPIKTPVPLLRADEELNTHPHIKDLEQQAISHREVSPFKRPTALSRVVFRTLNKKQ